VEAMRIRTSGYRTKKGICGEEGIFPIIQESAIWDLLESRAIKKVINAEKNELIITPARMITVVLKYLD